VPAGDILRGLARLWAITDAITLMFCRGPESGYQPMACCIALSVAGPYTP